MTTRQKKHEKATRRPGRAPVLTPAASRSALDIQRDALMARLSTGLRFLTPSPEKRAATAGRPARPPAERLDLDERLTRYRAGGRPIGRITGKQAKRAAPKAKLPSVVLVGDPKSEAGLTEVRLAARGRIAAARGVIATAREGILI